ncbi:hypothetical protein ACFVS2_25455 [Brevibacillus sp. NPDC058079]|uniref:hypothetical protein n=1 Tax=Brevibacillus sp. NPDC058079 TaxID=3346330 RepID=UPI0036F013C7
MAKVIISEDILNKGFKGDIEKVVQTEDIQEGEPFVILQTVAVVGKRIDGNIVIEKMLPQVL